MQYFFFIKDTIRRQTNFAYTEDDANIFKVIEIPLTLLGLIFRPGIIKQPTR